MPDETTWADAAEESFLRWCSEGKQAVQQWVELQAVERDTDRTRPKLRLTKEGTCRVTGAGVVKLAVHALEGGRLIDGHR